MEKPKDESKTTLPESKNKTKQALEIGQTKGKRDGSRTSKALVKYEK